MGGAITDPPISRGFRLWLLESLLNVVMIVRAS